jgi:predicted oxidoreductase (fatty acid repression mutant protein)
MTLTMTTVWTLLEAEGLGCSLQHYNPLIDLPVSEQWGVPQEWRLQAQLVFGKPTSPPPEKTFQPIDGRIFIHGK